MGFIADYGDDKMMADLVEKAIYNKWNKQRATNYILENHTWDKRAAIYDKIIKKELGINYL